MPEWRKAAFTLSLREEAAAPVGVTLHADVCRRLVTTAATRLPQKTFGYLLSADDPHTASDFIIFENNVRNGEEWRRRFETYGRYFVEHDDAGFVADPGEAWRVQERIWRRGLQEVAVFHTHQRHPANFSRIDYELHLKNASSLWHLVISLRNPDQPQLRAFDVDEGGVRELPLYVPGRMKPGSATGLRVVEDEREGGNRQRRSPASDRRRLLLELAAATAAGDADAGQQLLTFTSSDAARARYREHLADLMVSVPEARFEMGTAPDRAEHFCGETPSHRVSLSPYRIARHVVTNEMFCLFDPTRPHGPAYERSKPATNVSWLEAAAFSAWMGCRLPTEAEWEYACGTGSGEEWTCSRELELGAHAWYSENARGAVRPVAGLLPNSLGLSDLHGNVWEWCMDVYSPDFYARSPRHDPVNLALPLAADTAVGANDRVCRGGSIHALAEMCRTRYRLHEPPEFAAADLGFRLVAASSPHG